MKTVLPERKSTLLFLLHILQNYVQVLCEYYEINHPFHTLNSFCFLFSQSQKRSSIIPPQVIQPCLQVIICVCGSACICSTSSHSLLSILGGGHAEGSSGDVNTSEVVSELKAELVQHLAHDGIRLLLVILISKGVIWSRDKITNMLSKKESLSLMKLTNDI